MHTHLSPDYAHNPQAQEAAQLLRQCVHCGFCTATCPTYQLLGDELDGPRGRIYQIKQVLEGQAPTRATQQHLDRCLTCRNCESTCPSGMQYGALLDIGRQLVDAQVARPWHQRAVRWLLWRGLASPLFAPLLQVGQWLRPVLPAVLRAKVPPRQRRAASASQTRAGVHAAVSPPPALQRVVLLQGCVQPAMAPNINAATERVLAACGVQTVLAQHAGCCGALAWHLNQADPALAQAKANIDAWWPLLFPTDGTAAAQAIVVNASGCTVMVKDYGHLLAHDPAYAERARQVSSLCQDLSELLPHLLPMLQQVLPGAVRQRRSTDKSTGGKALPRLVFHPPCTLQHGQQLRGGVESALGSLGFSVRLAEREAHLCCGSAGTYSVLQPALSGQLRQRKLAGLAAQAGEVIVSANVGCITHLQAGTTTPVRHWVEVVDAVLHGDTTD
ncbi:glycolate oxidase subunit GlcF [Curvibacter sp. CHRR-16]|uniref:glycolate oxidase subunit GlcF n=1 Tax=Curvibacter sp. CHRR-16 TaxID=2835872 RepID=UPI001BDAC461|nr:glycolate oxidase subunit GlcF [Curvibacter sp. CHRR-16]MBT0570090.1 glycolate oxidase subunit GlcF [Curvibacter sp. CHRR-16]